MENLIEATILTGPFEGEAVKETQREITDWDTGTQMTTRTQGHNYNGDAGGQRGGI